MGLKREGDRAVNAVREKIKSKFFTEKTQISMTETDKDKDIKAKTDLKEGETYKDRNGTEWKREKGMLVQQGESRLNLVNPLFCPKCKKIMGGPEKKLNSNCYMKYGHCFSCQLKEEKEQKLAGTWDEWVEKKAQANREAYLRDLEDFYSEYLATDTETQQFVMNSSGELETWIQSKGLQEKEANELREYVEKLREKVNKEK